MWVNDGLSETWKSPKQNYFWQWIKWSSLIWMNHSSGPAGPRWLMVCSVSQDDPFFLFFNHMLWQQPLQLQSIIQSLCSQIFYLKLSCQILPIAVRLKGERQTVGVQLGGRVKEAKRVAERMPTDTVNKLSQTLFWGVGRAKHELVSGLGVS